MKPSTAAELAGFGLLAYAAYSWQPLVGLALGGLFLLIIGFALDDSKATISLASALKPVAAWRAKRREQRAK